MTARNWEWSTEIELTEEQLQADKAARSQGYYSAAEVLELQREEAKAKTLPRNLLAQKIEAERTNHPFWHYCRKCVTFLKLAVLFVCADIVGEFITFVPIHRFFELLGWI